MAMATMRNILEYEPSEGPFDSDPNPKPPSSPLGPLIVRKRTDSIVDLQWKPPLDHGTSSILMYKIQRQKFTEGDWTSVGCVLGIVTRLKVTLKVGIRLKEAGPHRFRVIAANAHGRSEPLVADGHVMGSSKESSTSVAIGRIRDSAAPLSDPSAPIGPLTIERASESKVLLSWRPPATDGGSPIHRYVIERSTGNLTVWCTVDYIPGSSTSVLVKSPISHQLAFRVIAVNMHGGYSIPLVTEAYVTKPKLKVALDVATSRDYIEVKWTIPVDTQQPCDATGAKIYIRKRAGSSKFEMIAKDLTGDSYRDFDVVHGRTYQYEVVATAFDQRTTNVRTSWVKFGEGQQQASNGGDEGLQRMIDKYCGI